MNSQGNNIPKLYLKIRNKFLQYAHIQTQIRKIERGTKPMFYASELAVLQRKSNKILVEIQGLNFSLCDSKTKKFFYEYVELAKKRAFFRYVFLQEKIFQGKKDTNSHNKSLQKDIAKSTSSATNGTCQRYLRCGRGTSQRDIRCGARLNQLEKEIQFFGIYSHQLLKKSS